MALRKLSPSNAIRKSAAHKRQMISAAVGESGSHREAAERLAVISTRLDNAAIRAEALLARARIRPAGSR